MLNNTNTSIPTLITQNGVQASTSNEKATTLNNYFFSCFNKCLPPLTDENLLPPTPSACPESILIAEEYVATALLRLESTGVDGISAKMLKHTAINIAPSLAKLCIYVIHYKKPNNSTTVNFHVFYTSFL